MDNGKDRGWSDHGHHPDPRGSLPADSFCLIWTGDRKAFCADSIPNLFDLWGSYQYPEVSGKAAIKLMADRAGMILDQPIPVGLDGLQLLGFMEDAGLLAFHAT